MVHERDKKTYGEHRTERMTLEVYDPMQHAIDTGEPYTTVVDPPPGQGARHQARDEALT